MKKKLESIFLGVRDRNGVLHPPCSEGAKEIIVNAIRKGKENLKSG